MTKGVGTIWAAALTGLAVGVAACGSGGGTGSTGLSVSVRSTPSAATPSPAGLKVLEGVTLSRIRMAVRRISVEGGDAAGACDPSLVGTATPPAMPPGGPPSPMSAGSGGGAGGGDDGRPDHGAQVADDGHCELAFGPFDVDLAGSALSGAGVDFAFSAPIPAGTYHEVSITVNTVPAARAGGNPVLADLAAAHASILVDGFVQDATTTLRPFTFSTPIEVKQKREGTVTVGPGSNVTLTFDPSGWFAAPGGGRLDPADPGAQGAILANIRASLRLVDDDDHDGREDAGGPGHP